MCRLTCVFGLFFLAVVALARADDDKKLTDTPVKRMPLPGSFQAWMVTGKHAGRFHSPVCEIGLRPMALVITRDLTETEHPLAELIKKLDQSIAKHPSIEPGACAVFLVGGGFREAVDKGGEEFNKVLARVSVEKDQLEEKLHGLFKAKELGHVNLALASENALSEYKLDEKAHATVLLCHQQDVLARYDLPREKLTDETATQIAGEFEKLLQSLETPARGKKKK